MSLDRALRGILGDRATESTVREALQVLERHPDEWVSAHDVATRIDRPEPAVTVILSKLADGFVLLAEDDRYRIIRDPVVDLDVKRFLRRTEVHTQLAQDNLARFRDRYGHR
jgi:hypothetical protein